MTEYCKHGINMNITCRKCGRIVKVEAPNFAAKRYAFTNSIDRLEKAVQRMQVDLAKEPSPASVAAPQQHEQDAAKTETAARAETPPPAPPTRGYPWQISAAASQKRQDAAEAEDTAGAETPPPARQPAPPPAPPVERYPWQRG